jgi:hypothetical protein
MMGWLNLGRLIASLLDRDEDPDDYQVYAPDLDLGEDEDDSNED